MTPQEFIAGLEQQMAKQAAIPGALARRMPHVRIPAQQAVNPSLLRRGMDALQYGAGVAADEGLTALDNLGRVTRHGVGKGVDSVKDFVRGFRGGDDAASKQYTQRLPYSNPNERGVIPYRAPESRGVAPYKGNLREYTPPGRTWGNIGTGAGVAAGATYGLTAVNPFRGGGDNAPQQQPQMPALNRITGGSGGLMDMWNSLPVEARYAIGAGVPLALLGAFTHGSGNQTAGLGLGAAGLGLAGLGAARGGMFGSNMQSGAEGLMNMLTGQRDHRLRNDPAYHAYLQGQLSNGLAQNSALSKKSAYEFGSKVARCWAGYEPVPGKAPYSNDSCRPKKQKSKKQTEKKAIAGCGQTSMSATPSSRGVTKRVSDQQKSTPSPKPEDVGLSQLSKESAAFLWAAQLRADLEKEAFFGTIARGIGSGLGAAGNYIQGLGSAAQKGLNNFADAADQRGKQMYYSGARMFNNAVQPFRAAGAAVGGFGQGLVQGAQNIASLPGQAANAVVNAGSQAANAVGGAIQGTGQAIGDAAGTAYGAGRNAVVNTARDVRQGVNTAVDTAKSYVPNVRNPFYYTGTPGQPVGPQYGPQF